MQNNEIHFELIPIEVMERILREAEAQGKKVERTPGPVSLPEQQASTDMSDEEGGAPCKDGQ
jgi:hypothetical protein